MKRRKKQQEKIQNRSDINEDNIDTGWFSKIATSKIKTFDNTLKLHKI